MFLQALAVLTRFGTVNLQSRRSPAWSPGFFLQVSWSEAIKLLVCVALRLYVYYSMVEKKKPSNVSRLEEVTNLSYSISV